ncbi:hypothetical protein FHX35_000099 [Auritidibacter ignavus]|nr:hypothetical protein [Auritidibacter ignavus]
MTWSCTGLNHRNWPIKLHLFRGIDIGQTDHHATTVTPDGTVVHDKSLPPSEPRIQELLKDLVAQHAKPWVVVDQPKTIGTLVIAVAQQRGIQMPYVPGLTMRRVADLHPGQARTDARDADIIAETAGTMPHTLRGMAVAEQHLAELPHN